ncbi:MAG: hypothetical protein IPL73_18815 [Candidatus Obscuribacter sp.]|nr:hypothetical protein [Candidatus Obscuribacter sp.]
MTFQPTNSAPSISSLSINSTGAIAGTRKHQHTGSDPDSDNLREAKVYPVMAARPGLSWMVT